MQLIKLIPALALLLVVQAHFSSVCAQIIVVDSNIDTVFNSNSDSQGISLSPIVNSFFDVEIEETLIGVKSLSSFSFDLDPQVELISHQSDRLGQGSAATFWVPEGATQLITLGAVAVDTRIIITPRSYSCDLGLVIDTANTLIQNLEAISASFPFRTKNYGYDNCILNDTLQDYRFIEFDTLRNEYSDGTFRSELYINNDPSFDRMCEPGNSVHIFSDFQLRGHNRLMRGSWSFGKTEWVNRHGPFQNISNDSLSEPYFEHPEFTALFSSSFGAPNGWMNLSSDTLAGQYISVSTVKWPLRELIVRVKGGSVGDSLIAYCYKQTPRFSAVPLDTGNFRFPINPFIGSDTNFVGRFGPLLLNTKHDRYHTLMIEGAPINGTSVGDGLYVIKHIKKNHAGPDLYIAYDDLSGTAMEWQAMGMLPDSSWIGLDGKIPFIQPTFSDARTQIESDFGALYYKHDFLFDGRNLADTDLVQLLRTTDRMQTAIDTTSLYNTGGGLFRGTAWWPDMARTNFRIAVNGEFEPLISTDCWIANLQGDRYRQWQSGATQDTLSAFSFDSCELVELPGRTCDSPYVLDSLFTSASGLRTIIDTRLGLQTDPPADLEFLSREIGVIKGKDYGINFNGGGRWLEFQPIQSGRYELSLVGEPDSLLQGGLPKAGIAFFEGLACDAVSSITTTWSAGAIGLDTVKSTIFLNADSTYSAYVIDQHKLGSRLSLGVQYIDADTCRSSMFNYPAIDTLLCIGDSLTLLPGLGLSASLDYNNTSWLSFSNAPNSSVFFKEDSSLVRLWSHSSSLDSITLVAGSDLSEGVHYFQGVSWAGTHSPWLQRIRDETDGCSWRGEIVKIEVSDPEPLSFTIDYIADSIFVAITGGSGSVSISWTDGLQGARRSAFSDTSTVSFVISDANHCVEDVMGSVTTMVSSTKGLGDQFGLSVFPNPTKTGRLNIVASESIKHASIFNSIGQLILETQSESTEIQLSLPAQGLYRIEVITLTGKRQIRSVLMLGQ